MTRMKPRLNDGKAVLDNPGEVSWFHGHGPKKPIGDCDHVCRHLSTSVIAYGPDFDHYELVECYDCKCRSWIPDSPRVGDFVQAHWRKVCVND
jgi:hypothetical protein